MPDIRTIQPSLLVGMPGHKNDTALTTGGDAGHKNDTALTTGGDAATRPYIGRMVVYIILNIYNVHSLTR